ncbi:MAG: ATP-binding protein [Rhodoferax sp.]
MATHKVWRAEVSLFWRTFTLVAALLVGSVWVWIETLHELEFEPRAIHNARQVASIINLSRAAVLHTDAINRVSLFKLMRDQEHVTIQPREPTDRFEPLGDHDIDRHVTHEIRAKLGPETVVAQSVNDVKGLWVGFRIDKDDYWVRTERTLMDDPKPQTWMIWLLSAAAMSVAAAAWIAGLINKPLKDLSAAAGHVREGDFQASQLDERVSTREIRAVNAGFNRMTRRLALIEQERALMLAGISHDLRTPLARLRLELELSVPDEQTRQHMANDIDQIDAIIGKFLDYARSGEMHLTPVSLNDCLNACVAPLSKQHDLVLKIALPSDLRVMADRVELQRIITNLLENALRYGRSAATGVAEVDISARVQDKKVLLRLRDHGPGVPEDQLAQLTTPFFRGETARTAAHSTGLGLAIVERTLARMGASLRLSNARSGGFCVNILLNRAMG